jgi:hypothetical protein
MLLAIFDLLIVRLEGKRAECALRENLKANAPASDTGSRK